MMGPLSNVNIRFKKSGQLPPELSGNYTNSSRAAVAIRAFLNKRKAYFDNVKRTKDAKKGLKRLQKEEKPVEE